LLPSFASAAAILFLSLQQFALHGLSKLRQGWHGFVDIMLAMMSLCIHDDPFFGKSESEN
jgi:hypothetical protein